MIKKLIIQKSISHFTECVRLYQVLICYVICLYTQPTDLYVHKKTDFIEETQLLVNQTNSFHGSPHG